MKKGDRVKVYVRKVYLDFPYFSFKDRGIIMGQAENGEFLVELNEEKGRFYQYPEKQLERY